MGCGSGKKASTPTDSKVFKGNGAQGQDREGLGSHEQLTYTKRKLLRIKGPGVGTAVNMNLTDPKNLEAKLVTLNGKEVFFSKCVLPGMDPHGVNKKNC